MRTFQSQSQAAQRGASNGPNGGGGGVNPFSPASIILISALLILTIPVCYSAPAEAQKIMTDQLFSEIGAVCSSFLSEDLTFQVTDALGELCILMLVQKSKELQVRENSKRTPPSHPLLHLVPQLHTRRGKGLVMRTDFHGPAGIQNRATKWETVRRIRVEPLHPLKLGVQTRHRPESRAVVYHPEQSKISTV